ncbi:hypothetical protein HDK77DRAFT_487547 [Phyllosticta capitalensis]|uniref:Uncharacterized protein n=1 Tax=Phyllosticta capitalensis TaxID=121624 RepID=A0ABR1Z2T3_9PEZI
MGLWGEGVWQSETQFDLVSDLGHDMGVKSLLFPKHPERVRAKLNDGRLEDMFQILKRFKSNGEICLLAAAAMEVGADLSDDFRTYLKGELEAGRGQMFEQAQNEILEALVEYQNGVPHHFTGNDV